MIISGDNIQYQLHCVKGPIAVIIHSHSLITCAGNPAFTLCTKAKITNNNSWCGTADSSANLHSATQLASHMFATT